MVPKVLQSEVVASSVIACNRLRSVRRVEDTIIICSRQLPVKIASSHVLAAVAQHSSAGASGVEQ